MVFDQLARHARTLAHVAATDRQRFANQLQQARLGDRVPRLLHRQLAAGIELQGRQSLLPTTQLDQHPTLVLAVDIQQLPPLVTGRPLHVDRKRLVADLDLHHLLVGQFLGHDLLLAERRRVARHRLQNRFGLLEHQHLHQQRHPRRGSGNRTTRVAFAQLRVVTGLGIFTQPDALTKFGTEVQRDRWHRLVGVNQVGVGRGRTEAGRDECEGDDGDRRGQHVGKLRHRDPVRPTHRTKHHPQCKPHRPQQNAGQE